MLAITGALRADEGASLPPLETVAKWSGLAASNISRWHGTRHKTENWNRPSFDASEWTRAVPVEGATYPAEVVDNAGARYPIAQQLQYAFRPFWLPPASGAGTGQVADRLDRSNSAPVWFRQEFDFTEAYADCATYVSQDVATILYVNGVEIGSGSRDGGHVQKGYKIGPLLHSGLNTLAIEVRPDKQIARPLTVRTDLHQSYPVRAGVPISWRCSLFAGSGWSLPEYQPARKEAWTNAVTVAFSPGFVRKGEVSSNPIWHTGDASRQPVVYFRLPIDIAGLPNFGDCDIQADNGWELWVNGELAGLDKRDHMPNPTPVSNVKIGRYLHPGRNVIGVKAYNYGGPGALAVLPRIKISF